MSAPISFSERALTSQFYSDYFKPSGREWEISRIAFNALIVMPLVAPAGAIWNTLAAGYCWARSDGEKARRCAKAAFDDLLVSAAAFACCSLQSRAIFFIASICSTCALASLGCRYQSPIPEIKSDTPLLEEAKEIHTDTLSLDDDNPFARMQSLEDFNNASMRLFATIFNLALLSLIDLNGDREFSIFDDGRALAAKLKARLSRKDPAVQDYIRKIASDLEQQQDAVDSCKNLCQKAWGANPHFDIYPHLAHHREYYAFWIGNLEFNLLLVMKALNERIVAWSTQGVACKQIPYTFPLDGSLVSERISTILKLFDKRLAEEQAWLLEIKDSALKLQKDIFLYRLADLQIRKAPITGAVDEEIIKRMQEPQPTSFLDIQKVIGTIQEEVALLAFRANSLLSTTIKGDKSINENVRKMMLNIAYAEPLNPNIVISTINTNIYKLKVIQNEQAENYIKELESLLQGDGITHRGLNELQTILELLQNLYNKHSGTPSFFPELFGEGAKYKKIFHEGPVNEKSVEDQINETVQKCIIENKNIDPSQKPLYNQFKAKVLEKPNPDPFFYFGSKETLKSTRNKLAFVLHPDKNGGSAEAKSLFDCMEELYKICDNLLKG